ncbi:hypothetical protein E4P24_16190 [Haloferax sp. AS1]|uniref:hypothetical protein n=1 Tax=Haloferax TaxID=2251 RepID=UPI00165FED64|nr:hypothetical protein [Haloferax sp. AS1]MBC9987896.1 hypothetical protein [Haloferax sp. AS1]
MNTIARLVPELDPFQRNTADILEFVVHEQFDQAIEQCEQLTAVCLVMSQYCTGDRREQWLVHASEFQAVGAFLTELVASGESIHPDPLIKTLLDSEPFQRTLFPGE